MIPEIQAVAQLDRLVRKPARLMILMILQGVGETDFLYLLREGEFRQGNLFSHLLKLEEAGFVEIEKKFKGKRPLTVRRLTSKGDAALSACSQRMIRALQTNRNRKRQQQLPEQTIEAIFGTLTCNAQIGEVVLNICLRYRTSHISRKENSVYYKN
jgi:DNA-binding PadR family transcriptional regulator